MIELGDEARDIVTGFQGVVVSEHRYIHGCRRFSLQPKVGADGKVPDIATFDEPSLELVTKKKVPRDLAEKTAAEPARRVGGPDKFMDAGRSGEDAR